MPPPPSAPGAGAVRLGARGKMAVPRAEMPQDAMDMAEGAPVEESGAAEAPDSAPDDAGAGEEAPPADAPEPAMKMRRVVADRKDVEMDDFEMDGLVAREALARGPRPLTVREYAHPLRPDRKPGDRVDFTETLYWNAGLRTDATGTAKVKFHLSDSVTSFRAMADAVDGTGRLGEADLLVESREPFYLEPKLPLEVTAGDRILLPVALVNSTVEDMDARLDLEPGEGLAVADGWEGVLRLAADGRGRLLVPVEVGRANGRISFAIAGGAGPYGDRVTRDVAVVPFGFPIHDSAGGILLPGKAQRLAVTIPEGVHMSTVRTSVKIYPTPAANLTEALKALVREPYG
jgi:hypothetical protein